MALLSDPTVTELFGAYFAALDLRVQRDTLADSTRSLYEYWSRIGAMRWFAGRLASTLTSREIRQMQATLEREVGVVGANGGVRQLARVLAWGAKTGLTDGANPAEQVKALEGAKPRRKLVPRDKLPELYDVFRRGFYEPGTVPLRQKSSAAICGIILCGGRKMEILGAQRDHYDAEAEEMVFPREKSRRKRKGKKRIAMSSQLVQLVEDVIAEDWHPLYLFPSNTSKMGHIVCVRSAFRRGLKLVGLDEDIRIHDLRHTFADAADDEEDLETIAQMLGHLSTKSTKRYLSDSKPQKTRRAVQSTVDRMLGVASKQDEPNPFLEAFARQALEAGTNNVQEVIRKMLDAPPDDSGRHPVIDALLEGSVAGRCDA